MPSRTVLAGICLLFLATGCGYFTAPATSPPGPVTPTGQSPTPLATTVVPTIVTYPPLPTLIPLITSTPIPPTPVPPTPVPPTVTPLPPTPIPPTATVTPTEVVPTLAPTFTPTQHVAATRLIAIEYHQSTFALNDHIMMTPQWFDEQMRYLADNDFYTPTAQEVVAFLDGQIPLPQKSVVLTFDLGSNPQQDYNQIVVPTLQHYGLHGIFFVVINSVDEVCQPYGRFCWDDLRAWEDTGAVSYASHSVDHPDLSQLTYEGIVNDLSSSKATLEAQLGQEILLYAYPFEAVPDPELAKTALQATGYRYSFGGHSRSDFSFWPNDELWYNLPRVLPYSSPADYPYLTARTPGLTFAEMITTTLGLP